MTSVMQERIRKSRIPAKLDLWQSLTGLALGLFMWVHLILVSSILISKDAMLFVTRLLEGSFDPLNKGGSTLLPALAAIAVLILFVVHAGLAMRKFPANFRQLRTMRGHIKTMRHADTTQWWIQAVTGFVMFFLGSAHLLIMASNADRIGPYMSAERFVTWGLWPMYLILLFCVELHGAIGLYRLAVKWGVFDGKDPRRNRKRLKRAKMAVTVFFLTLGLLSFVAYMKIGLEREESGRVGIPYAIERGEDH